MLVVFIVGNRGRVSKLAGSLRTPSPNSSLSRAQHARLHLPIPDSPLQTATAQKLSFLGCLYWAAIGNRTRIAGTTNRSNKPLYDSRHVPDILAFLYEKVEAS